MKESLNIAILTDLPKTAQGEVLGVIDLILKQYYLEKAINENMVSKSYILLPIPYSENSLLLFKLINKFVNLSEAFIIDYKLNINSVFSHASRFQNLPLLNNDEFQKCLVRKLNKDASWQELVGRLEYAKARFSEKPAGFNFNYQTGKIMMGEAVKYSFQIKNPEDSNPYHRLSVSGQLFGRLWMNRNDSVNNKAGKPKTIAELANEISITGSNSSKTMRETINSVKRIIQDKKKKLPLRLEENDENGIETLMLVVET